MFVQYLVKKRSDISKVRMTEGWRSSKSVIPGCFIGKLKMADMSFIREVTEYKTVGDKHY
jgi:hypothetical protein